MRPKRKISIVMCCYNEYENIPVVVDAITKVLLSYNYYDYEIIMVNDGSQDGSQELMFSMAESDDNLFYIELSRNFGHQNALKVGLTYASGDCAISLDADMQHPPSIIPKLIEKWEEGYDIVYTRRMEDKSLSTSKRMTSKYFYSFLNTISDVKFEPNTADFRLLDRVALNALISVKGGDLFIRGIVSWMGFKQYGVDYEPAKRFSGKTKYNFKKMIQLALSGILSFSSKPLHIALYLGLSISILSLLFFPYVFYSFLTNHVSSGWSSMILTVSFLGGLQLFVLGIIGLYIGRIFSQTNGLPPYIVRSTNIRNRR